MLLQSAKSVPGYRTGQCIAKASVTSWHRPIGPGLKRTSSDVTASGSQHLFTSPRRTCSVTHAFREEKSAPTEGGTPAASAAAAHTAAQGSGTAGPAFSGRVEEELPPTVQTQALQVCRALLAVHDSAGAVPVTRSAELLTKLLDPAGMVLQADDVLTHADKQCDAYQLAEAWHDTQQSDPLTRGSVLAAAVGACITTLVPSAEEAAVTGKVLGPTQSELIDAFLLLRAVSLVPAATTTTSTTTTSTTSPPDTSAYPTTVQTEGSSETSTDAGAPEGGIDADQGSGTTVLHLYRITLKRSTMQAVSMLCCRQLSPMECMTRLADAHAYRPARDVQVTAALGAARQAADTIAAASRRSMPNTPSALYASMCHAVEGWVSLWATGADLDLVHTVLTRDAVEFDGYGLGNKQPHALNFAGSRAAHAVLSGAAQRLNMHVQLRAAALSPRDGVGFYHWVGAATDKASGSSFTLQGLCMVTFHFEGPERAAASSSSSSSSGGGSGGGSRGAKQDADVAACISSILAFTMRPYPNLNRSA